MTESISVGTGAWLWAFGTAVAMLLFLAIVVYLTTGSPFGPAVARSPVAIWYGVFLGVIGAMLLGMAVNRIEVDRGLVSMRGGAFFSRTVSADSVVTDSIRVHGAGSPPPVLVWRTIGYSMPGYRAGWFRDEQGAKAFVIYTGGGWVSFSTADGVRHVISTEDPGRLAGVLAIAAAPS